MTFSQILSITGLVLDIIGVFVIFRYGLPQPDFLSGGTAIFAESYDEKALALEKRLHTIKARIGLGFLVAGFLFQIAGTAIR